MTRRRYFPSVTDWIFSASTAISRTPARSSAKLRRASRERMKRKLRKYKVMYESGAITKEKITESYQSWRSHASHGDCHALIQKYDQLYNEIFERSETADVSINQRPAR